MNFLAHAYLSGEDEKLLIGNFIGDFVKGNKFNAFDEDIQKGILVHREIDRFTDTHEIVHHSKSILTEKYRHYSGVIVDIFYDHLLAKNWATYHDSELMAFTMKVYGILEKHHHILPQRVKYMLKYMIPNNWLFNYSFLDGIRSALNGMSRRTKFDSGMEYAIGELETYYTDFEKDFSQFFPQLINFVDTIEIHRA